MLAGVREQPRAELRRLPQAQAEVSGLAQGGHGVRVCVPDSIGGDVQAVLRGVAGVHPRRGAWRYPGQRVADRTGPGEVDGVRHGAGCRGLGRGPGTGFRSA